MATVSVGEMAAQVGLVERRAHPRIEAALPIEVRPDHSTQVLQLETTNISVGGCYIQMAFTLEVGRMLDLVLTLRDYRMAIRGVVVSRHPRRGNGIMFLEIARGDRVRLQNFLSCLRDNQKVEQVHHDSQRPNR